MQRRSKQVLNELQAGPLAFELVALPMQSRQKANHPSPVSPASRYSQRNGRKSPYALLFHLP
eukprot:3395388-Alexandrium_andersonii.AAC.1